MAERTFEPAHRSNRSADATGVDAGNPASRVTEHCILDDLDKTLQKLLLDAERGLPKFDLKPTITFATPDSKFSPSAATINLFLYDVRENRDLRTNELVVERSDDGKALLKPPPTRIDCSYLVTAWAGDGAAESEHRLLGAVMLVLLRAPTIPANLLQGELMKWHAALPVATLQPGRLQSIGEFWQASGGRPKAVLNCTVTISVETETGKEKPIVTERIVRMKVGATEET